METIHLLKTLQWFTFQLMVKPKFLQWLPKPSPVCLPSPLASTSLILVIAFSFTNPAPAAQPLCSAPKQPHVLRLLPLWFSLLGVNHPLPPPPPDTHMVNFHICKSWLIGHLLNEPGITIWFNTSTCLSISLTQVTQHPCFFWLLIPLFPLYFFFSP